MALWGLLFPIILSIFQRRKSKQDTHYSENSFPAPCLFHFPWETSTYVRAALNFQLRGSSVITTTKLHSSNVDSSCGNHGDFMHGPCWSPSRQWPSTYWAALLPFSSWVTVTHSPWDLKPGWIEKVEVRARGAGIHLDEEEDWEMQHFTPHTDTQTYTYTYACHLPSLQGN